MKGCGNASETSSRPYHDERGKSQGEGRKDDVFVQAEVFPLQMERRFFPTEKTDDPDG